MKANKLKKQNDFKKGKVNLYNSSKLSFTLGLICAAFAFLLYSNTLNHEYAFDDYPTIYGNQLTMAGVESIPTLFKTAYWFGLDGKNDWLYRPLSMAMFALEWEIAPNTPALGHWINVLLYALTGFFLFKFLKDLFINNSTLLSFAVTLLWIAHPTHTEVVANIKSRDEILAFLFCILSMHQALKFIFNNNKPHLIFTAVFYFLALLSKETPITVLVILPLTLYVFTHSTFKKIVISLIPLCISAAVYLIIRGAVLTSQIGDPDIPLIDNTLVAATDFMHRQATAFYILGFYIKLLFFPSPLSSDYSYKAFDIVGFDNLVAIFSLLFYIAIAVYAILRIYKKDPVAYGVLFYLIVIALVSNVLFLTRSTAADRFLYMPSLGFCLVIVLLISRLIKIDLSKKTDFLSFSNILSYNKSFTYIICFLLLVASIKTIARNPDWKNDTTIFSTDINHAPKSARLHFLHANHILHDIKEGKIVQENIEPKFNESIKHLNIAIELNPKYRAAIMVLADTYANKNNFPEAMKWYNVAIENEPQYSNAYGSIGALFFKKQMYDTAVFYLQKAIQLDSSNSEAYNNLGSSYFGKTEYEKAVASFSKAVELNPRYVDAIKNLGSSYGMLKQYDNSIFYFLKALEIQPNNSEVNQYLGLTYQFKGDMQNANYYFQRAQGLTNTSK